MWNARRKIIRDEHRAEGARAGLEAAWKQRLKSKGGAAAAAAPEGAAVAVADDEFVYETEEDQWARPGPARLAGPDRTGGPVAGRRGGQPACHPEAVSAAFTAAVEWRLMIEANTCTTQWQIGVGNEELKIICKKLDQISQKLESNETKN